MRTMNSSSSRDDATLLAIHLRAAKMLQLFRRYHEAESVYRGLMDQFPTDHRAFFNLATMLAVHREQLLESCALLRKVIELKPRVVESYGALAAVLIKLQKPEESALQCYHGLEISFDDKICLFNLNVALRQLNRMDTAIAISWETLIKLEPSIGSQRSLITEQYQGDTVELHEEQCRIKQLRDSLTFVCVKWGTKYSSDYVNALYCAVKRNLPPSYRFRMVCFTEDSAGISGEIRCIPFLPQTTPWTGWWNKAQVFAPHSDLDGWLLYLDLDTVVCGSLLFLAETLDRIQLHLLHRSADTEKNVEASISNAIVVLNAEHFVNEGKVSLIIVTMTITMTSMYGHTTARPAGINSSMMLWYSNSKGACVYKSLYDFLARYYSSVAGVVYKFDHYLEMMLYQTDCRYERDNSAQVAPLCFFFQDIHPDCIVDYSTYSSGCLRDSDAANGPMPSIVCFPLEPKPHQLPECSWIARHWMSRDSSCQADA